MTFEKPAIFLGYSEMKLRDGTVLYTVNMYVDNTPVDVNVLATNTSVASVVKSLSFGDTCAVTFTLRKTEKLYKLSLTSIA